MKNLKPKNKPDKFSGIDKIILEKQKKPEKWKKSLQIKFGDGQIENETISGHLGDLEDFIRRLLTETRQEEIKRADIQVSGLIKKVGTTTEAYQDGFEKGYKKGQNEATPQYQQDLKDAYEKGKREQIMMIDRKVLDNFSDNYKDWEKIAIKPIKEKIKAELAEDIRDWALGLYGTLNTYGAKRIIKLLIEKIETLKL